MSEGKIVMAKAKSKLNSDQRGLASILVTLIIMLIISLIVIGFARLSRREQRQSLDDQLSTQAFYAAESGINDATQYLKRHAPPTTTDCTTFTGLIKTDTGNLNIDKIDGTDNVKYTCLMINPAPGNLTIQPLSIDHSKVVLVQPSLGTINQIVISWQDPTNNTFCPTVGEFKPADNSNLALIWPCTTGVVRADILKGSVFLTGNRDNLDANVMTAFLYPAAAVTKNPLTFSPSDSGAIASGGCLTTKTPAYCSVTINLGSNETQVYLKLRSLYRASNITITALNGIGPVNLVGDQVVVDATGKANDILRRIQVRIPVGSSSNIPDFAIQSGDTICKRVQIDATTFAAVGNPSNVPACDILNP